MLIFNIFLGQKINLFGVIKNFFPLMYNHYWFITVYLYLMLLTPFLNKFVNTINHEYYKKCLIVLTMVLVILPTVFYANELMKDLQLGTEIAMFIYLYLLGGYIKKYKINFFEKHNKRNALIILCGYVFLTGMVVLIKKSSISDLWNLIFGYYRDMYSIWIVLPAISLFCIFKDLKIKYSKIINYLGGISLGVYLLHENDYMRPILWKQWFTLDKLQQDWQFVFYIFGSIVMLYIAAIVIEFLRKNIIEKNVLKIKYIDKLCNKVDNYINS